MKNKYFFLNTAQPEAKIAIFENRELIRESKWEAGRELSTTLSEKFKRLLEESGASKEELAGVLVFPGPGSFTGLRIGIAFANALAFGLNAPMYESDERGQFNKAKSFQQITPFYGAEPHITRPKGLK